MGKWSPMVAHMAAATPVRRQRPASWAPVVLVGALVLLALVGFSVWWRPAG